MVWTPAAGGLWSIREHESDHGMPDRASPKEVASGSSIDAEAARQGAAGANPSSAASSANLEPGAEASALLGSAPATAADSGDPPKAAAVSPKRRSKAASAAQATPAPLESAPAAAEPVAPEPGAPEALGAEPVAPAPLESAPAAAGLGTPEPRAAEPVAPEPVAAAPLAPAPVLPAPVTTATNHALPSRAAEEAARAPAAASAPRANEGGMFGLGRALKSAVRAFKRDKPSDPPAPRSEVRAPVAAPLPQPQHENHGTPLEENYERPAGLSGHTSTVAMPEVLGFLAQLRKSGTLWIWNDREQFRVQLVDGNVTYARSEAPRQGSLLGEILVSQGALDIGRFEQFLRDARPTGPLGDALIKAGLVSDQALSGALQYQAQRVFNRAYGLEDAYFRFDAGAELAPLGGMKLSVTHMLFESARSRDESEQRLESVLGDPFEEK